MKRLNEQRRRFVEAFMGEAQGNATRAAQLAGYSHPDRQGHRLLKCAEIRAAVDRRADSDPLVLTREQRLRLLSDIAMGRHQAETKDPQVTILKALDLLNKMTGVYIQRVEHTGKDGNPIEVSASQADGVRRIFEDDGARDALLSALGALGVQPETGSA